MTDISSNAEEEGGSKTLLWNPSTKKEVQPKPKRKRQVAQMKSWAFSTNALTNQFLIFESPPLPNNVVNKEYQFIQQQIRQKIYGYKYQDIEKGIYSEGEFIRESQVVDLLKTSHTCYYCKEPVLLLYEYVRDSKQWTLERIDNKRGHNADNIVVACLGCNLRRKTMYHERFVFTKQLNIVKQG
jgi:5-methylcytosine-specific restriction endonuclease McrA